MSYFAYATASAPRRVVAPVEAIMTLAEAKAFARIDGTAADVNLTGLIAAATAKLDGYAGIMGRALIAQTWEQDFSDFPPGDVIRLPLGDLIEVESISYVDPYGATRSFTEFAATSDAIGPLIVRNDGASWPSVADRVDAITIRWTCGYGETAADVDPVVILAAKSMVAWWYDNPASVGMVPDHIAGLVSDRRAVGT